MIQIKRWQGGGNNSSIIRLLVIRQAFVLWVRDVKVTDWPFWRLPSLQIGVFLITHEMKGFREEMTQNTQPFKYLIKAKKTCKDQTARLHMSKFFFFSELVQNLHFFPSTFCYFIFFYAATFVPEFGMVISKLSSHSRKPMLQSQDLMGGILVKGLFRMYGQV